LGRYGFKRQLQAAKHGTEGIPFLRWECVWWIVVMGVTK
jgi:hypothetical protein